MKDVILSLFGAYEPVMTTGTAIVDGVYESAQVVAGGFAGMDWPWIMTVLLFAVVLYSFFRMVGVLLK